MWKGVDFIITLASIGFYSHCENVTSDESNEENYLTYEYKQILQGIPSFMEYLFNTVEEHPDILERNDVTEFEKTTQEGDEEREEIITYNKRTLKSIPEENCMLNDEEYEEKHVVNDDESTQRETNKDEVTYEFRNNSTEAYKYDKLMLMIDLREDICEIESERKVKHYKSEDCPKDNNQVKEKQTSNKDKKVLQETEDVDWEADAFPGFKSIFTSSVTPEEIEESHIMTERLLEEYNINKLDIN